MTNQRSVLVAIGVVLGLLGVGCSNDADACADEQEQLARLSAEVDALIVATGCQRVEDCRAAALGASPCGGPSSYATYCAPATDVATLDSRRGDLVRQAARVNKACALVGVCEVKTPPTLALEDGRCVAKNEP
ncbi:hypothetical protein ACLESO_21295 [Pyxidicoccus sp. 3LG]